MFDDRRLIVGGARSLNVKRQRLSNHDIGGDISTWEQEKKKMAIWNLYAIFLTNMLFF